MGFAGLSLPHGVLVDDRFREMSAAPISIIERDAETQLAAVFQRGCERGPSELTESETRFEAGTNHRSALNRLLIAALPTSLQAEAPSP
jgi:hypothetical protein